MKQPEPTGPWSTSLNIHLQHLGKMNSAKPGAVGYPPYHISYGTQRFVR